VIETFAPSIIPVGITNRFTTQCSNPCAKKNKDWHRCGDGLGAAGDFSEFATTDGKDYTDSNREATVNGERRTLRSADKGGRHLQSLNRPAER